MDRFREPACRSWLAWPRLAVLVATLLLTGACHGGGSSPAGPPTPVSADPPSTLLPAGATTLALTVSTDQSAACRYSVGQALAYSAMTPFGTGDGTTTHTVTVTGLNPDPAQVNDVHVSCGDGANQTLHLRYRALANVNPSYPRTGNLWGSSGYLADGGVAHCARVDLWLGADFTPDQVAQLRALNPDVLVLNSINTVEQTDSSGITVPDAYWLRDSNGHRIEVWPGAYRLNLTLPEVAVFQAQYAYQLFLASNLALDGTFFDNFFTSISWLKADYMGNPVQVNDNYPGLADDAATLDAKWKAGVYLELQTWRQLMPNAYASGHLPEPADSLTPTYFNGSSIGFAAPGAKDGDSGYSFTGLWQDYSGWYGSAVAPVVTMIEGGPPFQIAYGYGYSPRSAIPAATWTFGQQFYPYMRFALGTTLMNDGYFAYELGDTLHGEDWWYDELDYDLGQPLGPCYRLDVGATPTTDLIVNGGFTQPLSDGWTSWADTGAGCAATFQEDTTQACRIDISNAGAGVDYDIALFQPGLPVTQGVSYDLTFQARADASHPFSVVLQKGSANWQGYGLSREFTAGTGWQTFQATFQADTTASDGRLGFNVGTQTGSVWIGNVQLVQHPPDVYRRDFQNGTVLLNGTRQAWTIPVSGSYQRLTGTQAPRYQYVVDDADAAFTAGSWTSTSIDSGQWVAAGPWYHQWGSSCHQIASTGASATWDLGVPANDSYTLAAWWPAAPQASGWSSQVLYEVVVGGNVVAAATLDQTRNGDQWNTIATVPLTQAADALVRITDLQTRTAIADAILVQSAARYNDGSDAATVDLAAMDAIVLKAK